MTVANIQQFAAFICGVCSTYRYLLQVKSNAVDFVESPLQLVEACASRVEWLIRVRGYGVSI
jgi:hypothetical protein